MANVVLVICVVLYNLAVIGGCAYVVFGLGYSGWWFVVAFCVLDDVQISTTTTTKDQP